VDWEGTQIDSFHDKYLLCSKNENYAYFRLKVFSIKLICMQKLQRLANIYFCSKSHSIISFSLSMIRMLLFVKNRFVGNCISTF